MALQAGYPAPKYEFEGRLGTTRRRHYLAAVTRAYGQDYEPLAEFFAAAIEARMTERRSRRMQGGRRAPSKIED